MKELKLNEKFSKKYLKGPKQREITMFFETSRSLHGAPIVRFVQDKNAKNSATLSEFRALAHFVVDGIDEKGKNNVLIGNAVAEIQKDGKTDFYFYLKGENRELRLGFDESLDKSLLYRIDVAKSMEEEGLLFANAVSKNAPEYRMTSHIIDTLIENNGKEAE